MYGVYFLNSVIDGLEKDSLKAAYVGASNGDLPEFYDLFVAAMENIGVRKTQMIHSTFSKEDQDFLEKADIVLLSGGDVAQGWHIFETTGIKELIVRKYEEGALLIGISAGAIQLGLCGCQGEDVNGEMVFDTFKIVPYVIGVHEEKSDWEKLKETVLIKEENVNGIGIPTGAGMIYHTDKTVEPIRFPLYEILIKDNHTIQNLIMPPNPDKEDKVKY